MIITFADFNYISKCRRYKIFDENNVPKYLYRPLTTSISTSSKYHLSCCALRSSIGNHCFYIDLSKLT